MMNNFADWLLEQLKLWDMSQADLARKAALTRSTISYYLSQKSKSPDEVALRKIAHAFLLPPETVFRAAGLLPPQSPENELINRIVHLTSKLPEIDQAEILAYAQMRHRLIEERRKNEINQGTRKATAKPKRA